MKNGKGAALRAQQPIRTAMTLAVDLDTGLSVMPEDETAGVRVLHSLKPTADGHIVTPAMCRQMGYGRNPFRDYPDPEDTRLIELVDMQAPCTAGLEGLANNYWWATFMRADGVRQSMVIVDLADARDALFEHLSAEDRRILALPFVALEVAA